MPVLSDKIGRHLGPRPTLIIFPKSPDQNSEIAILFTVVKEPYNYVFGDDLLPHSPHGRGNKLQTLTSAYISRNLSWGKKIAMKGAQDLLALFKKTQWKNKYEKVFFQLEVRSSIKT